MSALFGKVRAQHGHLFSHIDWPLFLSALALSFFGLVTMRSFSAENVFFDRQIIWISLAIAVFLVSSLIDYGFLRRTTIIASLYGLIIFFLVLVLSFGVLVKGAQNRFNLGFFAVQPSDPAKLILIALLAKYFARRHVEIAHIKHILVSGAYAFVIFVLVFFQPDLGSGIIIASIWLGMVLVSGISWKHLATLVITTAVVFGALWHYGLHPYQKQRILTFIHPLTDIHGSGYNAYQSTVAFGSGQLFGKGIGYGTQSKLRFLPEYQTDFIFASFAEEWGLVGVLIVLALYATIIIRILLIAGHGRDNFDTLFAVGVALYFTAQFIVHAGMNMGLLPITGATIPFMSYGGSHLLTEYLALGILMGMRRRGGPRPEAREATELIGAL